MSDTSLNKIIQYGTNAEMMAFTPSPPGSSQVLYLFYDTDNEELNYWDGAAWSLVAATSSGITQLTGNVTAGPGTGSQPATIPAATITEAMQVLADNTTQDVSTSKHGYVPKAPSDATKFLNGANPPAWTVPGGGTGNITSTGAVGSEPGSPSSGDLYLPNNGVNVERYSGSVWIPWGPLYPLTAPIDGDFAWINQGGAAVDTTNGGIHLTAPATAGVSWRIRKKAAPSPPYTITAAFLVSLLAFDNVQFGLTFRQSSDGKLHVNSMQCNSRWQWASNKYTSATAFSAVYGANRSASPGNVVWMQISDDNTNRILRISCDGQHWILMTSIGRTDFLTADEVGWGVMAGQATFDYGVNLIHWKET